MSYSRQLPTRPVQKRAARKQSRRRRNSIIFLVALLMAVAGIGVALNGESLWSAVQHVAEVPKERPSPASAERWSSTLPSDQPTVIMPQPAATGNPQPVPSAPAPVYRHDYGSWSYSVHDVEEGLGVVVHYDKNSVAGLIAYASLNRDLAADLASTGGEPGEVGEVQVEITFRALVGIQDYREWVEARGVKVETTGLQADSGASRHIFYVESGSNDVLPWEQVIAANPGGPMPGVFYALAYVPAARLLDLTRDPLVFIADVTPNIVYRDLMQAGVSGVKKEHLTVGSPFHHMEKLGLENFAEP